MRLLIVRGDNKMFDNNDEFGVEQYDNDFNALFETYKFLVKLISPQKTELLQGDFLGTKTFEAPDKESFIYISSESIDPTKQMHKGGYTDKGEILQNAICRKGEVIKNGDTMVLLQTSEIGLIGEKFIITPTKIAQFKIMGSFQEFSMKKV